MRFNKKGDVLIAMYGATIGKLAIAGIDLTTNQACCACTPHMQRLKNTCGGTLIIESKLGEGTKATITIPKKSND